MSALNHMDVPVTVGFFQKPGDQGATVPTGEAAVLPAEEVAGMDGDEIQKRRLAVEVANGFER
jgi:hypothetical protein